MLDINISMESLHHYNGNKMCWCQRNIGNLSLYNINQNVLDINVQY